MDKAELKDWELRTGHIKKEDLLNIASLSEIRHYEDDLPGGAVLDIGSGLGSEALYFSEKGRVVYAIDKESYFLDRIKQVSDNKIKVIETIMPDGTLPVDQFALVILSHILHFLSYKEAITVCQKVAKHIDSGCYILVRVHSKKHPYSNPIHEKNGKFQHFFDLKDIRGLFPLKDFEVVFHSTYQRNFSIKESVLMGLSGDKINSKAGYTIILRKK